LSDDDNGRVRHIHLFLALGIFFLLYFGLRTFSVQIPFNRFVVYGLLVGLSIAGLLVDLHYFGDPTGEGNIPDWDENLKFGHLKYIIIGLAVIIGISMAVDATKNLFYFTSWSELESLSSLSVFPSTDFYGKIFQEGAWQLFIVAYAEELIKLSVMLPFIRGLQDYPPFDQVVGAGAPILLWAQFHTILAYGQNNVMVLAAFLAGVVLYISLILSGCVLVPIIIHALYNLIVVLPTMGVTISFLPTISASATIIPGGAIAFLVVGAIWIHKKDVIRDLMSQMWWRNVENSPIRSCS